MSVVDFRHRGKGKNIAAPCGWQPAHADAKRKATGRYRMAILGHPVKTHRGFELYVCEGCKTDIEKILEEAKGDVPAPELAEAA